MSPRAGSHADAYMAAIAARRGATDAVTPTPRGADVVRRARQLGLSAEYVGPGVKIGGRTWTVAEADAYLRGYFDGAAKAHRTESEQRLPRVRRCPGSCGRPILYGTCIGCMRDEAKANR